jgi:hypothetical protein
LIDRGDEQPFTPRGERRRWWLHLIARIVAHDRQETP